MPLIRSISGMRGTLGGRAGESLSPDDIIAFTAAFFRLIKEQADGGRLSVITGRDARTSGEMVTRLVHGTLMACGADVTDLGVTTTPTVEMAVSQLGASGGIIVTASHNPANWNALKFLNRNGEFIGASDGERLLNHAASGIMEYASVENIGTLRHDDTMLDKHIAAVIGSSFVDVDAIRNAGFSIVVDAVNSSGGIAVPKLLKALRIKDILEINCIPDGNFAHNPEPLPEHLHDLSAMVKESGAHLGFAVDPDVDRLAVVCEDGRMFGEEYTLVAVADYVLGRAPGPVVNNLSSTRALSDVAERYKQPCFSSAVGEVNVVALMKEKQAVVGGEGNGGIILPSLHYGRDALIGIALFLSHLAGSKMKCSTLRKSYPEYVISKNKISLGPGLDVDKILYITGLKFGSYEQDLTDGLKIYFEEGWVHLRKSNTEPIIRIYAEGRTTGQSDHLAAKVMETISQIQET